MNDEHTGDDDFLPLDLSPFDDDPSPPRPSPAAHRPSFGPEADEPILAEVASGSPFGPAAPAVDYLEPPRLGIIHLLAWTAAAAVFLSISSAVLRADSDFLSHLNAAGRIFHRAIIAANGLLHGAALVGAVVVVRARLRQRSRRLQPGHWLLIVGTAAALVRMVVWALLALIEHLTRLDDDNGMGAMGLGIVLAFGVPLMTYGAGYWLATLVGKAPLRWKVLFGFLGTMSLLRALGCLAVLTPMGFYVLGFVFNSFWAILMGVFFAVVFVIDLAARGRRDWLHWLGVAFLGFVLLLELGWQVGMMIAQRLG
jgi:hypothetical protein